MANKNIWQMDALPVVADDTMIPVIATNVDTSTNNKMSASQIAQYVSQHIASLTRTAYVGTGAQYAYKSMFQAWDALGSPLNIVVCTDITEDGDIVLDTANSYLSITHAYNVTVDRGDFSFIASDVSQITLKIDGSFAIWNRNYKSNKASIDFKTSNPDVMIIKIKDIIDLDQSADTFGTPFIIQAQPLLGGFCEMKNVTLLVNNNATSTNQLINASLENIFLVGNASGNSSSCISLEGSSKISGLNVLGDFASGAVILTVNKYSSYYDVSNLTSSEVIVETNGGNGANLYGVNSTLGITCLGDELNSISPKVVNGNNTAFYFEEGDTEGNSSASISNSDVISVDNSTIKSGNFKFSNCQVIVSPAFTGKSQVAQWSNCNFTAGYSIDTSNTLVSCSFAGYSDNSTSLNFAVVSPSENSVVVGTTGNVALTDSGTDTEQGLNTTSA